MKNSRVAKVTLTISLILIVILGITIIFYALYHHSYVSVEATIIETYVDTGLGQGTQDSAVKYAIMEYSHNGNDYTYKKNLGLFENYSNGDKVWIKCNPQNFGDVENQNTFKWLCIVEGVLIVWSGGLLFAITRRKNNFY